MTSERKIAANRRNAQKSRGPRSAAGKSTASRNALRHGLAAVTPRQPGSASEVERFAKALCGDDDDPFLCERARIIAQNNFVLAAITAQQLAVIERLREPSAIAFAKGDNTVALCKARSLQAAQAWEALVALRDKLLTEYKDQLPPPISGEWVDPPDSLDGVIPPHLEQFLEEKEPEFWLEQPPADAATLARMEQHLPERSEGAALEEAALDLIRLERHEKRAWSRQKRAIAAFMTVKIDGRFARSDTKTPR